MHVSVRRGGFILTSLALLAVAGCQPFTYEKSHELATGIPLKLEFDPPRGDQKVTVTVTASEKVSAYLYLKENEDKVEGSILAKKLRTDLLLGSETDKFNPTFEAIVPGRKYFKLYVASNKKTEAKVKVTGR
jgi:hypothetical protein